MLSPLLLATASAVVYIWSPSRQPAVSRLSYAPQCTRSILQLSEDSEAGVVGDDDFPLDKQQEDKLSQDLSAEIETRSFNEDLYRHLALRPEYQTSELYKQLRKRVDVSEPLYTSLEENKDRALSSSEQNPDPAQTPGEVIDLVLRALREKRGSDDVTGIEVLMKFMSPSSSIHTGTDVTPAVLLQYFMETKYAILMDWVAVQYHRKLELSMDKRHARQQLRLKSITSGAWVPITFQLKMHETSSSGASVWLIDQVLVKSSTERGIEDV